MIVARTRARPVSRTSTRARRGTAAAARRRKGDRPPSRGLAFRCGGRRDPLVEATTCSARKVGNCGWSRRSRQRGHATRVDVAQRTGPCATSQGSSRLRDRSLTGRGHEHCVRLDRRATRSPLTDRNRVRCRYRRSENLGHEETEGAGGCGGQRAVGQPEAEAEEEDLTRQVTTRPAGADLRIAVLAPIAWRVPPRHYGPWEQFASLLTEGLVGRGVDVTLFATADSDHPRAPRRDRAGRVRRGCDRGRQGLGGAAHRSGVRASRRVRRDPQRLRFPAA